MNTTVSPKRIERLVFCVWCISFQYPRKFYSVIWYNFDMVGYLKMRIKLNYVGCYLEGRWGLLTNVQVSALLTSFQNQGSIVGDKDELSPQLLIPVCHFDWCQNWRKSDDGASIDMFSYICLCCVSTNKLISGVLHFSAICRNTFAYSFHCPPNKFCWLTSWLWH